MGAFRALFGALVVLNAFFLYPDLEIWFSEAGVLPSVLAKKAFGTTRFSVFWWLGSSLPMVKAVFTIHLIAAWLLCFGLFSRVAAIVVSLTLISFHQRNIYILHSGDTLMRLLSFFLMFADSGAAFSLDRLIRDFRNPLPLASARRINPLPMRLMQIQLCIVYLSTFSWKAMGNLWLEGKAVFVVNQIGQFERFPLPPFMKSLFISKVLSWYTLLAEAAFPFLVWFRTTRLYMLTAMLLLHVGLEYTLNIQLFQPMICSVFVLFLTEEELRRAAGWVRRCLGPSLARFHLVVFFDGSCGFCKQSVKVLQRLDFFQLLIWEDNQNHALEKTYNGFSRARSEHEILTLNTHKRWRGGFKAMRSLAFRTPLLLPFACIGYIPLIPQLGSLAYAEIAKRRHRLSAALGTAGACSTESRARDK